MTTSGSLDCLDEANESLNVKLRHPSTARAFEHLKIGWFKPPLPPRVDFSESKSLLNFERKTNPQLDIHIKKAFFPQTNKGFLSSDTSVSQICGQGETLQASLTREGGGVIECILPKY